MTTVRFIDLFAGIGGMSCGFVQASTPQVKFDPVLAVEMEHELAEIYKANFGDHVHVGDIADVKAFPSAAIVIGGPPCQGFSPLGRDRDSKSRAALNSLWRHFVRALEQAEPHLFVMENVPELLKSAEYRSFKSIAGEQGLGFDIREDVLLAADFGVPQLRRRAIVIGSKLGAPPWPLQTHFPPEVARTTAERWQTFRQAVEGLPLVPDGQNWHRPRNPKPLSLERYRTIPNEGENRFDLAERRPDITPDCWHRKKTGATDVFGRLWWGRPSFTIRTEFYKPEKGRYLHPSEHRPITVREAACLQSFPRKQAKPPRGFIFPENLPMVQVAKGIGNAVPPKLARAIAVALAHHLLAHEHQDAQPQLGLLEPAAA